ncbi:hypothetical protein F8388_000294 [Cannabis sativa]|uniref:RNase H type-1 domain-containing protein n=1 Tax=Cannabis sativa TaxID=3483 RepID=A0A7J6FN70_CANSA|nr:hypothetical protein F8388_000294 [Cannabis sativa]
MGDLNTISGQQDKVGGREVEASDGSDLNELLDSTGGVDLGCLGNHFTWTNGRRFQDLIKERLYRALCDPEWMMSYPKAGVLALAIKDSDHAPLVVDLLLDRERFHTPFRYLDAWSRDEGCKEVIQRAWAIDVRGAKSLQLVTRLDNTRRCLAKCNKTHFGMSDESKVDLWNSPWIPWLDWNMSKAAFDPLCGAEDNAFGEFARFGICLFDVLWSARNCGFHEHVNPSWQGVLAKVNHASANLRIAWDFPTFKDLRPAAGIVVSISEGSMLEAMAVNFDSDQALEAEMRVVIYAVNWCKGRDWKQAVIVSDCQLLVHGLHARRTPDWRLAGLFWDLVQLLVELPEVEQCGILELLCFPNSKDWFGTEAYSLPQRERSLWAEDGDGSRSNF